MDSAVVIGHHGGAQLHDSVRFLLRIQVLFPFLTGQILLHQSNPLLILKVGYPPGKYLCITSCHRKMHLPVSITGFLLTNGRHVQNLYAPAHGVGDGLLCAAGKAIMHSNQQSSVVHQIAVAPLHAAW